MKKSLDVIAKCNCTFQINKTDSDLIAVELGQITLFEMSGDGHVQKCFLQF